MRMSSRRAIKTKMMRTRTRKMAAMKMNSRKSRMREEATSKASRKTNSRQKNYPNLDPYNQKSLNSPVSSQKYPACPPA
jgi:hypothetical protein